jgi:hypothetical protein
MKDSRGIYQAIIDRIGRIYQRPAMYGGDAQGVYSLLFSHHDLLTDILERPEDFHRFRSSSAKIPADCAQVVAEWQEMDRKLGIIIPDPGLQSYSSCVPDPWLEQDSLHGDAALILEGIVTSMSSQGEVNIAPMGPRVDSRMRRLLLRPFPTSQTYRNLKEHGEGVLHVTDDVLLLAQAALGPVTPEPPLQPAVLIKGSVIRTACRWYEFKVVSMDESGERVAIECEVIYVGHLRDFFGFNRAKHAVVEAAILATRTDFLPLADIEAEFKKLEGIVGKTGGEQEKAAFRFLNEHVERVRRRKEQA